MSYLAYKDMFIFHDMLGSHVPCSHAQGKYQVEIWLGVKVFVKELFTKDLMYEGL
jgi:hypothetical protein